MSQKINELLLKLREWCDEKYGRRAEAAKAIGTSRQTITHWFAGRQKPTGEQALKLQEFLKRRKK